MLMPPSDGFLDEVGEFFGPHERGRMVVPGLDIAMNVRDERPDGVEGSAADGFPRQDTEPDSDQIEPRGPRWGEMKLHARMRLQPGADRGRRMRGRVVENHVKVAS